ncbi:putative methyltransferase-domain-containing protein [Lipomyces oligophaga]|uniref:putative methyltransferase-domain-containing protein n=1 Tax=Lipomyces oligophaga TaxID=45792 RepID=UPI0034CD9109
MQQVGAQADIFVLSIQSSLDHSISSIDLQWLILLRALAAWRERNWDYAGYPILRRIAQSNMTNGRQPELELTTLLYELDTNTSSGLEFNLMKVIALLLRAECEFEMDKPEISLNDVTHLEQLCEKVDRAEISNLAFEESTFKLVVLQNLLPFARFERNGLSSSLKISYEFLSSLRQLLQRSVSALMDPRQAMSIPTVTEAAEKYKTLYRIVLREPFPSTFWDVHEQLTVHLGLVTEMNLFPRYLITPEFSVHLSISFVTADGAQCKNLIAKPVTLDGISRFYYPGLNFNGFQQSSKGVLSIKLQPTNEPIPSGIFALISIDTSVQKDEIIALPLLVGPFQTKSEILASYRPLYTSNDRYLAVEESLSDIPGKIWDSVVFILQTALQYIGKLDHPASVLDLSTGNGAAGLSLIKSYPRTKLTMTDLDEAIPLIKSNAVGANLESSDIKILPYVWGSNIAHLSNSSFDVVIACDLIYEVELFPDLLKTLDMLCKPGVTRIFIGYKHRGLTAEQETDIWTQFRRIFQVQTITSYSFIAPGYRNHKNSEFGIEIWQLTKNL